MKLTSILFLVFCSYIAKGQELYVYTEPASNMPARSYECKDSALIIWEAPGIRTIVLFNGIHRK